MKGNFLLRLSMVMIFVAGLMIMNSRLNGEAGFPPQPVPRLNLPKPRGGDSSGGTLSADGRVIAFTSSAANLVTNRHPDLTLEVYARNRQTGEITLVSANVDGHSGGDNDSSGPCVSADGRWVAFMSRAQNLVTNQTSGLGDIYVRDLASHVTRLVSMTAGGSGGDGASIGASITPDGRFVVFESAASDLVANDTNGATDVFARDLQADTTTLVSVNWQGTASADPVITPDGRYVAFQSLATNLVNPGLQPRYSQIYVRDRFAGTNFLVSVSPTGEGGAGDSAAPLISVDGRYVVFQSQATNLVPGAVSWRPAIYRRDLQLGGTVVISQTTNAVDGSQPAMSADGDTVAFLQNSQLYLWNAGAGAATLIGTNASGQSSQGHFASPVLSEDGRRLVFLSDAADLAVGASNGQFQVYTREVAGATNTLVSATADTAAGSSTDCSFPALSSDGRVVTFEAYDGNLVQGQSTGVINVFARDLSTTPLEWISAGSPAAPPTDAGMAAYLPNNSLSTNGRYVLFTSAADNVAYNHTNGLEAVFLWDTLLRTNLLVSVSQNGPASDAGTSRLPAMTPDARFVAFISGAADLVVDDTNKLDDVFVRDLRAATTTLASVRPLGLETLPLYSLAPVISADGRYVACVLGPTWTGSYNRFVLILRDWQAGTTLTVTNSQAHYYCNLTPVGMDASGLWYFSAGPTPNSSTNLCRYDVQRDANERLSGISGTQYSLTAPAITPDGRFVAARTTDGTGKITDVWRYDAIRKTVQTLASALASSAFSEAHSRLSISTDGRFTAFITPDERFSALDQNNTNDVYVADATQPGAAILVSVNQSGTAAGNGPSDSPNISGDGRFVAFRSLATDLTSDAPSAGPSLFVRDLRSGVTRLISSNTFSFPPWLCGDGRVVAFESQGHVDYAYSPDVFIVRLSWEPAFALRILPFGAGQPPSLVWTAESGKNYGIQFKNRLSDAEWQLFPGVAVPRGTNELLMEDATLNGSGQRYYRAFLQP